MFYHDCFQIEGSTYDERITSYVRALSLQVGSARDSELKNVEVS